MTGFIADVPILSQPEGQELRNHLLAAGGVAQVPILSQPEGQELLPEPVHSATEDMFQSSPSPKARSYDELAYVIGALAEFQSSPSPKARSYLPNGLGHSDDFGREFQSSPSPKARSYFIFNKRLCRLPLFQSSPSPKARSYDRILPD